MIVKVLRSIDLNSLLSLKLTNSYDLCAPLPDIISDSFLFFGFCFGVSIEIMAKFPLFSFFWECTSWELLRLSLDYTLKLLLSSHVIIESSECDPEECWCSRAIESTAWMTHGNRVRIRKQWNPPRACGKLLDQIKVPFMSRDLRPAGSLWTSSRANLESAASWGASSKLVRGSSDFSAWIGRRTLWTS